MLLQPSLTFEEWRNRARPLLAARIEPDIACRLIADDAPAPSAAAIPSRSLVLPSALMRLLDSVSCFRAAGRYELMYRLAWRALFENSKLLEDAADAEVRDAMSMDAAIRRDVHKMHAFVRFREISGADGEAAYVAWFEPEHDILRRGSSFFVKRFPNMRWSIATPQGTAVWDKSALQFCASADPSLRRASDAHEQLWRTYYRSICNVARINVPAMQREMPQRYWKNLPEAADIGALVLDARINGMEREQQSQRRTRALRIAAQRMPGDAHSPEGGPQECRRCDLWKRATQAVLGQGSRSARIMLVGEQPGDAEDLQGLPFVGPAGRILDEAIAAAGLVRSELFVTNAVKHFKWEPRGKRRLHKKPDLREISACGLWLEGEIAQIQPAVIVALGATALRALVGSKSSIEAARHQTLTHAASQARALATYHPSAILRAEGDRRASLHAVLVEDLAHAKRLTEPSEPAA
jgi:DNA polymerase